MNAQFFGSHFRSGDAISYLLERDVTRIIRVAVIGLHVDAEGRKAAIVGRTQTLLVNVLRSCDQLITDFLR